ncbi:MAG: hypothetical protein ABSA76_07660, partial [Bacteroidales bacterium]
MATISFDKYATGAYPFPLDEINPKKKDEDWGRKWCEAMYARWRQDKTAIPYCQINEIDSLRALADGRQNVLQYQ